MRDAIDRFNIPEQDIRETPPEVYAAAAELSGFDWVPGADAAAPGAFHDPCPLPPVDDEWDGLKGAWRSPAFVNPPFSRMEAWAGKALREQRRGVSLGLRNWARSSVGRGVLDWHPHRRLRNVRFRSP
eukprot:gene51539-29639_t